MPFQSPLTFSDSQITISELKQQLEHFTDYQKSEFLNHHPVNDLVLGRSEYMDQLLYRLWEYFQFNQLVDISLVAVGGYGRGELHPLSDIDILVVSTTTLPAELGLKISEFITLLWDLRLEVGHAVRTVKECADIGREDLTVATNLQEARLLCGSNDTFHHLKMQIHSESFWPSETFYRAKIQEQRDRHARYHDTTYNLEPDIKSTPGGLRDIHTLSWVARRHFGATSLLEMSRFGFLTDAEYRELVECQDFLWRVRFALHIELKRYDNRLTFAHQAQVAEHLGFTGEGNRGVEMMMKEFYRTLRRVAELNKMLLRLFAQAILNNGEEIPAVILDDDFQRRGNLIEARKPALFQARPETILDMFIHIANDSTIESVAPATMRQLRTARRRLNKFLHTIPEARETFMALVRHPNALHRAFSLMHKLGVLAAYLPQWSQIVGQMQFDLFHVYTVDEHSIRLLKHINTFNHAQNHDRHPICCEVYPRLQKKELLILAAIFHDIGKGRGGDHSEIGATEAYNFCIEHGLSKPEAKLVAWLVQNHLLMSVTAQRRDIYDPDVITEFAKKVRDEEYLEHLVCLTVADICATNPELWNSWKRTLLAELFHSTQRALRRGLENPVDVRDRIRHNQQLASALLRKEGFNAREIEVLWQRFKADYFLRHTHKQIAWHCTHLLRHEDSSQPLILLSKKATRGGTEVFVYTKDQPAVFATVVAELDRRNLSVHDAQIMSSKDGYVLDTFMVLDHNGEAIDEDHHDFVIENLLNGLKAGWQDKLKLRRTPRNLQHFKVKTRVDFLPTKSNKRTLMEFVALDTPGLLATVGRTFTNLDIHLHGAKITTIGERAEDLFILTSSQGGKLSEEEELSLRETLIKNVSELAPN
ncbi:MULTISPECIES: bifunctional uridylyltransferase/uridylyl-removing protein GlnD [Vibrio]|uniref:Bifunctional uridylyltransferase/uridylyl-removing enzyme n=1 Tax=Vibrio aestuarianus TaxID=28171 RepID=A0ABD7YI58_9VIBR|nr:MULTISPECIES: bifunctional uridylyltransferase/uridylyl-removing protein GlnD [Vibrio]MDE1327957.1 bifunctional uridylyltransferase/uridylyl-removing protein GlnD [Vibrio aestuarianus]MDF9397848.1 bifunctional uridylyltransferase/uridylyl-removing protein GlnD [Vibrio sp. 1180_3]WGK84713.1 bifunctional uridylyltransferase/uridylyl-removing protein GlnD [Vibrio aestuarianus]CAH8201433.1 PII uridylyltransferase/uridylyl removing enzyme [Vibrio aestuarianus]CAH8216160.1 (Protein-PII) uridylylt